MKANYVEIQSIKQYSNGEYFADCIVYLGGSKKEKWSIQLNNQARNYFLNKDWNDLRKELREIYNQATI